MSILSDEFAMFVQKHASRPVRFRVLGVLAESLLALKKDCNARIEALEQRVTALEARPSVQDKGIWKPGEFYQPGDIVSRAGSAWICRGSHMAVGDDLSHDHFRLLVKRGRDGRDARS